MNAKWRAFVYVSEFELAFANAALGKVLSTIR